MKITGVIVHGKQLGRAIGFPTANIRPDDPASVTAENGVYVAVISIAGYPGRLPCMLNQGSHPTAPGGAPTIEAHILDFSDDIYNLRATVEYLSFLRPEQKFPSLTALREQLQADLENTKAYFAERH